eukprot:scaffold191464_cov58-Attheya_sp.AAC.4
MARGQRKPSTQGLRDAATLATIGIILDGGERMLVAEPDTQNCCVDPMGDEEVCPQMNYTGHTRANFLNL